MRLGKITGVKLGSKDMVGLKIGNGPYLYESTGPGHLNKYTIQIPRGKYITAVVHDDSLSRNEDNHDLYVDWGEGTPEVYDSTNWRALHVYNTYGIADSYATYKIRTTGELKINVTDSELPGDYIKDIGSVRTDYKTGANLFEYYSGIKTVREPVLERLNTSAFINMANMFNGCSLIEKLNLASFDTSNVTYMDGMFSGCNELEYLDVSSFNTSKVISMNGMFAGCKSLTKLNLSNFDTSSITGFGAGVMFKGCYLLCSLNISNFDLSNACFRVEANPSTGLIAQSTSFLEGCNMLNELRLDNCNKDTVEKIITSPHFPTNDIGTTRTIYCQDFGLEPPINWVFNHNIEEEPEKPDEPVIPPEPEEPEIPLYKQGQFKNNATITEVETMVDSSHPNLSYMFYNCYKLNSVNTEDWDTSNVKDMSYMFNQCIALTSLDLSAWDTGNVTQMHYMFYNCFNLEILDIRNFKAPSVGLTDSMFDGCNKLRVIRMDNCDNRAMKRFIDNQENFPTGDIGVERVIYCKESSLVDSFGNRIYPPTGWRFETVSE